MIRASSGIERTGFDRLLVIPAVDPQFNESFRDVSSGPFDGDAGAPLRELPAGPVGVDLDGCAGEVVGLVDFEHGFLSSGSAGNEHYF